MANFGEGAETPLPLDDWLRDLQHRYPAQAVTSGHPTEVAFRGVFSGDPRPPDAVFADILAHLDNQLRGYQWRVRRMIPKLETWLREGRWRQLHDEHPPTALLHEKTLHTAIAADAFVDGDPHDPR